MPDRSSIRRRRAYSRREHEQRERRRAATLEERERFDHELARLIAEASARRAKMGPVERPKDGGQAA